MPKGIGARVSIKGSWKDSLEVRTRSSVSCCIPLVVTFSHRPRISLPFPNSIFGMIYIYIYRVMELSVFWHGIGATLVKE